MSIRESRVLNVPWTALRLPKGFNARGDDLSPEAVATMAASIKSEGLVNHPSAEPREEDGKTVYDVTDGFNRAAAILRMGVAENWPDDYLVTVTAVTYTKRLDPFVRNLVENVVRHDLRTADLAKRCYEIVDGALPDPRGGFVMEKMSVQKLADKLRKSPGFVRELVRAWRGASPKVRKAWREEQIATDQVRAWCRMPADEQEERLAAHLRGEKEAKEKVDPDLQGDGISDDGPSSDEDSGKKTNGHAEAKAPSRAELVARADAIGAKLDSGKLKGEKKTLARGRWEALRWAAGEVRRLG